MIGAPIQQASTTTTELRQSSTSWLRVLVVKSDPFAAQFIRQRAATCDAVCDVKSAHTAAGGLLAMRSCPVHLGIFGLTFSDTDGIDLISYVRAERLAFRILVVSSRNDETARSHLRPGLVDGYFNSQVDDWSAIDRIIAKVANGGSYFSPNVNPPFKQPPPFYQLLSPHEQKLFALLGDGCDDKTAARMLDLSVHTIHAHRSRIMRKLGLQSRTELMRAAIQRGVVRITSRDTLRPGLQSEFQVQSQPSTSASERRSPTSSPR